jgi:hypothetical protein
MNTPDSAVGLVELKAHVDALKRLLDEPEPGLSSWHEMVAYHVNAIASLVSRP